MNYYNLKKILSKKCDYNIIFGERGNGKTYACIKYGLQQYIKNGSQFAYIRRWKEDILAYRMNSLFNSLAHNNEISKMTKGKYDNVIYTKGCFYLAKWDNENERMIADKTPCGYAFCLNSMEHDKSTSYPKITNIIFDEFLTRMYIVNEFTLFMNVLSTIIRQKENVKIFMLGNTITTISPYFTEMGLTKITDMQQNTIDVYKYGNEKNALLVAVEYCGNDNAKTGQKYFSFDNPKLKMITSGKWELSIYPHLPLGLKLNEDNRLFIFTIQYDKKLIQGDVYCDDVPFIYFHKRTSLVKENELLYSNENSISPYRKKFFTTDFIDSRICDIIKSNKIFFADNSIGELFTYFIKNGGF